MPQDVFLSYSSKDQQLAGRIAQVVESNGYSVWYYSRNSIPGGQYFDSIRKAIDGSKVFAPLITCASLESQQIDMEFIHAHESGKFFLPVLHGVDYDQFRLRRPNWPLLLRGAVALHLVEGREEQDLHRIVLGLHATLEAHLNSSAGTPPSPSVTELKEDPPPLHADSLLEDELAQHFLANQQQPQLSQDSEQPQSSQDSEAPAVMPPPVQVGFDNETALEREIAELFIGGGRSDIDGLFSGLSAAIGLGDELQADDFTRRILTTTSGFSVWKTAESAAAIPRDILAQLHSTWTSASQGQLRLAQRPWVRQAGEFTSSAGIFSLQTWLQKRIAESIA